MILLFFKKQMSRNKRYSSSLREKQDTGDIVLTAALLGQINQVGTRSFEGRSAQNGGDFVRNKIACKAVCG
jgi:hypothetical protein